MNEKDKIKIIFPLVHLKRLSDYFDFDDRNWKYKNAFKKVEGAKKNVLSVAVKEFDANKNEGLESVSGNSFNWSDSIDWKIFKIKTKTEKEIIELITQMLFYGGYPAIVNSLDAASSTFSEYEKHHS